MGQAVKHNQLQAEEPISFKKQKNYWCKSCEYYKNVCNVM